MSGISDIVARMQSNPDRGVCCAACGTTAKDCQITFITADHRCCSYCDDNGGGQAHSEAKRMLSIVVNGEAS